MQYIFMLSCWFFDELGMKIRKIADPLYDKSEYVWCSLPTRAPPDAILVLIYTFQEPICLNSYRSS